MNVVRLLPFLCLSASLLAQTPTPTQQAVKRTPQIRGAQNFTLLPQIVDGDIWSTEIKVVSLDPLYVENYEVAFYDETGAPAAVNIVGKGMVTSVSGTLSPGQTVSFLTADVSSTTQTTWGMLTDNGSRGYVSVYESIRDRIPSINYFAETAVSTDYGFDNTAALPGGFLAFDNTNGAVTALAVVNPDFAGTAGTDTLDIQIVNADGKQGQVHQLTVPKGTHQDFLIQNAWPETKNAAGTLHILPSTGTFSPVSILALSSFASGNYKTLATINILQPVITSP